jgi:hypothetical protein
MIVHGASLHHTPRRQETEMRELVAKARNARDKAVEARDKARATWIFIRHHGPGFVVGFLACLLLLWSGILTIGH